MRTLVQPGPVAQERIDTCRGTVERIRFRASKGTTVLDGLTGPMVAAGFQSGTMTLRDASVGPFQYVMPGPPDGPAHVAYFSAPRAPEGVSRIGQANATFGWNAERPFLHCHAIWTEPDGSARGGHIVPPETVFASDTDVEAWGFRDIRMDVSPDAETGFSLFQPNGGTDRGAVFARVKPNVDFVTAVEDIAARCGMRDAVVRGSLGSLVGAVFVDGPSVPDYATEVLVASGSVRDGQATLDLHVVGMDGRSHSGRLARGENAVLITFDLVLEPV